MNLNPQISHHFSWLQSEYINWSRKNNKATKINKETKKKWSMWECDVKGVKRWKIRITACVSHLFHVISLFSIHFYFVVYVWMMQDVLWMNDWLYQCFCTCFTWQQKISFSFFFHFVCCMNVIWCRVMWCIWYGWDGMVATIL